MANAVFTTKVEPVYDDLPERRYHFPKTYLNQASQAVGDFIVYYEPRREGADLSGRAGRQAYFATARLEHVEADRARSGYYYAYVSDYLEFPNPVSFRIGSTYLESALKKEDGSTNRGAFGRSVRVVPPDEYQAICSLGFAPEEEASADVSPRAAEVLPELGGDRRKVICERTFRDDQFARVVNKAYNATCAMTGLKLVNGGGRREIEAAHIMPVADKGPDSPRNGIALSRTVHWMFDRGFLSISDTGEILRAESLIPDPIKRLLNPDGRVILPTDPKLEPHREFLRFHRECKFKGN